MAGYNLPDDCSASDKDAPWNQDENYSRQWRKRSAWEDEQERRQEVELWDDEIEERGGRG